MSVSLTFENFPLKGAPHGQHRRHKKGVLPGAAWGRLVRARGMALLASRELF